MSIHYNWAQKKAQSSMIELLSGDVDRTYVDMPTGTGKTGVMLGLLDLMDRHGMLIDTTILAPTRLIADNTFAEIKKFAPRLLEGNKAARLQLSDLGDPSARRMPLKIMTYQSAIPAFQEGLLTSKLIMPDEGQHALSAKRQEILRALPYANKQIAFTASPDFSTTKSLSSAGYRLAYHLGLREAVEGNILSSIRNVMVEMNYEDLNLDDIDLRYNGEYEPSQLERIVNDSRVLETMYRYYSEGRNPVTDKPLLGTVGIAYCNSIAHAVNCADYFNGRFARSGLLPHDVIPMAAIWGAMPKNKKDDLIDAHRSGKILLLSNADYLVEGYDNPKIETALNGKPTRSGVVAEQRGGRPIRYDRDNPDKVAVVADFVFPGKRNEQLLYGDAIGGYFFNRADHNKFSHDKAKPHTPQPFIENTRIYYRETEIANFVASRRDRNVPITSLVHRVTDKTVKDALIRKKIHSVADLMGAVDAFLQKHDLQNDPAYRKAAVENTILLTLKGQRKPFMKIRTKLYAAYCPSAFILSGVLEVPVLKLFGPIPQNAEPRPDPVDVEFGPRETVQEGDLSPEEWHDKLQDDLRGRLEDPDMDLDKGVFTQQRKKVLAGYLDSMQPYLAYVLRARFGINAEEQTQKAIGEKFNVTSSRISTVEAKALRTFLHPSWYKKIYRLVDHPAPGHSRYFDDILDCKKACELLAGIPKAFERYQAHKGYWETEQQLYKFKDVFLYQLSQDKEMWHHGHFIKNFVDDRCFSDGPNVTEAIARQMRFVLRGTGLRYESGQFVDVNSRTLPESARPTPGLEPG